MRSLKSLKAFLRTKPTAKILIAKDTTINGILHQHSTIIVSDTTVNNEHLYLHRDFFLNKKTALPVLVTIRARNNGYGDGISDYYDEVRYFNYQTDLKNLNSKIFTIPTGFHPQGKAPEPPALLTIGNTAPPWTLSDASGKQTLLAELKGKVILLDFYFISCGGCMQSLKPMNSIYERYKGQNVVIASVTERDSEKKVLEFEKPYQIKYPSYVNATNTVKSYHVTRFPTFYFIDKEGKIGDVFVGYSDDFEKKTVTIIEGLLNK